MTLAKVAPAEVAPPMVSMWTAGWGFITEGIAGTAPASATYESANRGVYFPLWVPCVTVAKRMWWANGATATGNVEAGLYRDSGGYKPGDKLVTTGSVGQAVTNTLQFADITDTTLTPGRYWLYLSCSSTSSTFFRSALFSVAVDDLFRFDQASIGPGSAPSSATPAEASTNSVYVFGFATHTVT